MFASLSCIHGFFFQGFGGKKLKPPVSHSSRSSFFGISGSGSCAKFPSK